MVAFAGVGRLLLADGQLLRGANCSLCKFRGLNERWADHLLDSDCFIAALIVAWVVWSYVFNTEQNYPVLPILPLVLAVFIWLIGWVFASRR
jgi:hypothetical protein